LKEDTMPSQLTYPGVYIEEIPSGVRTITGVATSITAFMGRARTGPVDEPVTINNYGDFERQFGGLGVDYPMSYAVRDFYNNGGSQALIVRLYAAPDPAGDANSALNVDTLTLEARSPGEWGRKLRATTDVDVSNEMRQKLNIGANDALFNLSLRYGNVSERFLNLTTADTARRIDRVLESESRLVRWKGNPPTSAVAVKAADDAATAGEKKLAAAKTPEEITAAGKEIADAEKAMKGANGGDLTQTQYEGAAAEKTGIHALDKADLFNLLCIPPDKRDGDLPVPVVQSAMGYCEKRRAMLIVDSPKAWSVNKDTAAADAKKGLPELGLGGPAARNAALYFPRLRIADPLREGQVDTFVPCGAVAGIMARTDTSRGVWKAPAGLEAAVNGIQGFNVPLNDDENGMLNPLGINCLRAFPVNGRVVWGARTLRGADQLADEYKYVPVRRTALFIEESLYRGTQWVVFEPNDEPLWAQIRLNVGAFMHGLFRQGAFQGQTPRDAYFVKCDKETTTQDDINKGIVNILVGFAPLKPAEFVVIKLQQIAGQIQA
jgi:phage tail sheath protein FI